MAVVFDSASSAQNGSGGSSLSFSHTLGSLGSTGLIIVGAVGEDTSGGSTNQRVTGITYNGVAMTLIAGDENTSAHSTSVYMYELHGTSVPVAGTYTVAISYTSSCEARAGGCMSFSGVKSQAVQVATSRNGNGVTPFTQAIVTTTVNSLVLGVYGNQNDNAPTWGNGETQAFRPTTTGEALGLLGGYKTVAATGSVNVTAVPSNPETEALIVASFEVAPNTGGGFLFNFV